MEMIEKFYVCSRCKQTFSKMVNRETAHRSHFRFCPECAKKNIQESMKRAGERRKVYALVDRKRKTEQKNDLIWYDLMAKEYGTTYGKIVYMVENCRFPEKKAVREIKPVRVKPAKSLSLDKQIDRFSEAIFRAYEKPKYMIYGETAPSRYMSTMS